MKDFVPYNEALALKELGFDEPCLVFYEEDNNKLVTFHTDSYQEVIGYSCLDRQVTAPTYSQAFRWFREKYELFHSIIYLDDNSGQGSFIYEILNKKGNQQQSGEYPKFETYEEAELACLQKLIQIVKDEKHTHTTN